MQNINRHISMTLRTLRQQRGWSLDKTAQETGVSKAMLGQIEREESSPTLATLWKIARGFNTSFSSLLEDIEEENELTIYRTGKQHLTHDAEKIIVTPLFPYDKQLHCEIFVIELLPGCEHLSPAHETGVIEHIIVVKGTLEILLKDVWHTVNTGDGLRFHADQAHGYRNLNSHSVLLHNIIHYPFT